MAEQTMATAFKLLMKARWQRLPQPAAEAVARTWQIEPDRLPWISASPLRNAQLLNLEVDLQHDFSARITFPDGSHCDVALVGFKFLD